MNNAEKFQEVFGLYATELWAKPENEFLEWLNADYTQDEKTVEEATLMETKEVWNRRVTPEVKTQYLAVELEGLKSKTVG